MAKRFEHTPRPAAIQKRRRRRAPVAPPEPTHPAVLEMVRLLARAQARAMIEKNEADDDDDDGQNP